eukprot:TRINITY_DN56210_c0_g1_i1.p1 TRINITY_DN56210_c0_g1~~TRINITY_DN56210_c0_g1_i1.p1  ORF type:complete len:208 (-),score=27.68 TRINITY_DN56210_c0_g1_i1:9-632(-)
MGPLARDFATSLSDATLPSSNGDRLLQLPLPRCGPRVPGAESWANADLETLQASLASLPLVSIARRRHLGSFLSIATGFQEEGLPGEPGCVNRERPCPEIDVGLSVRWNRRLPPKGAMRIHEECCHAINRTSRAAARAEALVRNNYYLRYLMAGPVDVEPAVALFVQWWRQRSSDTGGDDADEEEDQRGCAGIVERDCVDDAGTTVI